MGSPARYRTLQRKQRWQWYRVYDSLIRAVGQGTWPKEGTAQSSSPG